MEFYVAPKDLIRSTGFVSPSTGEFVNLTPLAKIVYLYMMSQNKFFTETLGGQHYETQSSIAEACDTEYLVVGRIMKTFITHGVVKAEKRKPETGGNQRWFYTDVVTSLTYWKKGDVKILNEVLDTKENFDKMAPQTENIEYDDEFLQSVRFQDE